MVDYGRNLVGNIKVKTRSSGGSFVDMGKTKSDIDKNIHEMEKLVNEIKADPRYSSDSGKMINDLKEDIRKLRLIQYDSQGKPTEESLIGIYGKDVKNAKFKDKDGTLFEISQYPNGAWFYEIFDGNGHRIGDVGPFRYEDDAVVALKRHNSTVRKIGNISIKSTLEGGRIVEIGESKDQIKIYINNLQKDRDRNVLLKDKCLMAIEDGMSDLKKLKSFDGKPIELSPSNQKIKIKDSKSVGTWLKNVEYKLDKDKKELKRLDDYISNFNHDIKAMEDALKKFKVGNINIRTKTAGGKLVNIGDTEDQIKTNINIYKDTKKRYEHRRDQYNNIVDYYQKDLDKVKKFKDGASIYIQSLNELVDRDVLAKNVIKTLEGRIKDNEKEVKFYEKSISDTDHDIKAMEDALKKFKVGNKNVVTLRSIPKRIDLDKKSDLEKAIKDITDLSKDYEHGIKVNGDDKYMHDKFVGLLKEANDEVKELKKILAKLN